MPSTVGLLQFYTAVFFWSMGPPFCCVGETSFGDVPDACNTTPFTFRHTYRCNGVDDDAWDPGANGCVFVPRVFLKDNWGWCTKAGGAEKPFDLFCRDNPIRWIPYPNRVIVR